MICSLFQGQRQIPKGMVPTSRSKGVIMGVVPRSRSMDVAPKWTQHMEMRSYPHILYY